MIKDSSDAPVILTSVWEAAGYYTNRGPAPGLILPESLQSVDNTEKRVRYSTVLKKLDPSGIYELSGTPCFYFKWLDNPRPDPRSLADLHRLAWNNGLAPVLWIVTPTQILLYDCFSKPELEGDAESALISRFENTASGLARLSEIAGRRRVESGEFWSQAGAERINRRNRIDATLLEHISSTEKQLTKAGLNLRAAHALITRGIFLAYLQDRKIVTSDFLRTEFGGDSMFAIVSEPRHAAVLFDWLRETFNGDLFAESSNSALQENDGPPGPEHLQIVSEFLSGTEMISGQKRFWPYDFSAIPVELISSIYERFAYSGDLATAKHQSTHYTPINLVDIVLSQLFSKPRPNARVLDMSCGSGVFLVESLRRIVAQRVIAGAPWNRETIHKALYDQIFGIDINPEAIRIAMFSLYLTALELDPNPQPPTALKFKPLVGRNLIIGDAFPDSRGKKGNPFPGKTFDLIVGNPPWSRRSENRGPSRYCQMKRLPLARRDTPDEAFLWRALDFSNAQTIVGLILHGKPFFSHTTPADAVRRHLVNSFKPKLMMNLSGLRQEALFPTSAAPAMILVASVGRSDEREKTVLVTAQRDHSFRHHGIVELEAEDVKEVDARSIGTDPDYLKVTSWGSPRDLQLVRRLRNYPTLGEILDRKEEEGWAAGQGLQLAGGLQSAPELRGMAFLQVRQMRSFQIFSDNLDTFGTQTLHRPRDPRIYRAPLVITPRGMDGPSFRAAYSDSDLVYTENFFGVSIPRAQEDYAHYLNAIFNSQLATYFLFITGSSWGVERDEVKPEDLRRLPIPPLESVDKRCLKDLLSVEKELRSKVTEGALSKLNALTCAIYELDEPEQFLVSDFVEQTLFDWHQGRRASTRVKRSQLNAYMDIVSRILADLLSARGQRTVRVEGMDDTSTGLCVVRLQSILKTRLTTRKRTEQPRLSDALSKVETALNEQHNGFAIRRVLRIYGDDDVIIVKPADVRYWTRSRALNDADAIIAEHLQTTEWYSPRARA